MCYRNTKQSVDILEAYKINTNYQMLSQPTTTDTLVN